MAVLFKKRAGIHLELNAAGSCERYHKLIS